MTALDQTRHCPMCEDAAKKILELEQRVKVLTDDLGRVKSICLRELGIGIVDENVLNQTVI